MWTESLAEVAEVDPVAGGVVISGAVPGGVGRGGLVCEAVCRGVTDEGLREGAAKAAPHTEH